MSSSPPRERAGFTLVELMLVLLVLGLVMTSIAVPFAAHLQMRRAEETRRQIEEAREALMGFAAANGRLPCPATDSSNGLESFAAEGDAGNGNCTTFYEGFLPAATLGLAPLDAGGYLRDGWATSRNRLRYAVFGAGVALNGVVNALTRSGGMQAATLPGLADASHYLLICGSAAGTTPASCGPAANQLTKRAAFVVLSLGPNAAATPAPGSDEARNLSGVPVFVHREASVAPGNEYDDIVHWVPINLLVSRMLTAGRLP
jgi:prepilin-type N-terminal cleavage/methylation domain-containing protein